MGIYIGSVKYSQAYIKRKPFIKRADSIKSSTIYQLSYLL